MEAMISLTTTPLPTDRLGRTVEPEPALRLLEPLDAAGQLAWGYETFGEGFALTTSFGIQSAVLLHMASRLSERIPVLWVDTGYLPSETYLYADRLCTALNLNLKVAQADLSPARMEALYGRLPFTGENLGALVMAVVSSEPPPPPPEAAGSRRRRRRGRG